MYRTILKDLQAWKNSDRRRPLLLKGGIKVGKTWTLKEFGRLYYEDVLYVDCRKTPYMSYIADGGLEAKRILTMLSAYHGEEIIPGGTLLIFDEIQTVPGLMNTLLSFSAEMPEYHICISGNHVDRELPAVEEDIASPYILELLPMSFKEFLIAGGNPDLIQRIENDGDISDGEEHLRMLTQLGLYFLVGGLPKAVETWITTGDFGSVRDIHRETFEYVGELLCEMTSADTGAKAMKLLRTIPEALKKENKKYNYGLLKEKNAANDYAEILQILKDTGTVNILYRVSEGRWPPEQYIDEKSHKLYFNDIGFLSYLYELETSGSSAQELAGLYNGALTEQFAYQELKNNKSTDSLVYWTSQTPPAKAEFLFPDDKVMIPIELARQGKRHGNSLSVFAGLYNAPVAIRFSFEKMEKSKGVLTIPLYAIWNL